MDEIGWQLRERADDRPVHRVALPAFAIGAYEVTNAEYAAFARPRRVGRDARRSTGAAAARRQARSAIRSTT